MLDERREKNNSGPRESERERDSYLHKRVEGGESVCLEKGKGKKGKGKKGKGPFESAFFERYSDTRRVCSEVVVARL